jgi:TolB-like protein/Tfp pilus assembly protein PilF
MDKPSRPQPVRFGFFELDLDAGELRKQGTKIRLQEQPFQVLVMLLERPGQVVSRDELRKRLWSEDTFVDFDHSLNKAVNKLREALGDSADGPMFIETLARRGYRFIVPLEGARPEVQTRKGPIDSIAVFPFEHGSTDPDADSLGVGIPGSIIHSISQVPGLRVISWRSTASDQHGDRDPLVIGRKLGVKAVLTGRIWQRANKVRLHVDLLDTASGEEIWGDQYDRDVNEIFEVQDDISREISRKLRLKMTGEDETRVAKRYTENIEAYQLYVRARRWCETRSAEGFRRGTEYLKQAIQMDPNYALAHAELAQCISVPCYYGVVDPNVAYPRARAAAERALAIDPNLAEAHEVLATVLKNYDWNWKDAEGGYKHTISLNPNYASGHYHYSYLLAESGRFEEAIREATEALSRDPMSPLLNAGLAFVLLHARKYDQCIEQVLTASEVDPNMTLCYWTLGVAYEQQGRFREALETYDKGIELGAAVAFSKAFISHACAGLGDRERVWSIVRELQELSKTTYVSDVAFAIAYEGLVKKDLAIEALEKACENRNTNLVLIKVWPHFDKLRDDPRFQEVERRVGLRV